ncbi:spore coat U domain-containing protein [Hafnia alvei]|uniref:spore coat U domain-containing protein n=1 Tax=Hafnia alvei TaxID=569 RepID=UPI00214B2E30|nr:spore coat U domain-containing protein [Hafnia alvei]
MGVANSTNVLAGAYADTLNITINLLIYRENAEWCALKVALQPLLAVVLLWGLTLGSANAIITAQFKAQATIVAGCAVLGTGSLFGTLSFGTYPGTGTGGVNGTFVQNTSLTLACTPGVTLNMAINGAL